jgi:hypothetical protein
MYFLERLRFKGKNKETREKIFDEILANNITSISALKNHLENSGYTTKYRNEGKGVDKEYLNIIDDNGVSINLRDKIFQAHFLSLNSSDKIQSLKKDIAYIEP